MYGYKTQCQWLKLFLEHTQINTGHQNHMSQPVGFLCSRLDLLLSGILVLAKQVGAPTRGLHYPGKAILHLKNKKLLDGYFILERIVFFFGKGALNARAEFRKIKDKLRDVRGN